MLYKSISLTILKNLSTEVYFLDKKYLGEINTYPLWMK